MRRELYFDAGRARPDYTTIEGAAALKAKIEAAWAARGGPIPLVWIKRAGRGARDMHAVASNMLNGRPVGAARGGWSDI